MRDYIRNGQEEGYVEIDLHQPKSSTGHVRIKRHITRSDVRSSSSPARLARWAARALLKGSWPVGAVLTLLWRVLFRISPSSGSTACPRGRKMSRNLLRRWASSLKTCASFCLKKRCKASRITRGGNIRAGA